MKKILLIIPLIIVCFVFFPTRAIAAYDQNLVITDAVLTAKNSMTEAQIQEFLVAKGSFLSNFIVPAPRTVTYYIDKTRTLTTYENSVIGPYGVSTEVDVQGWKASRVIWQVAQWYGVNPQVVLTVIEKESSFILGRTSGRADGSIAVPGANSYATYAWIMGYAYTEDTSNPAKNVCGTATPGANPSSSCAGFAAQLDNGTWALANWMNLANAQSAGNNYTCSGGWSGSYRTNYATRLCDGEWITPRCGATAALYRYTPHTGLTGGYSGNRAFYLIYHNWFQPYEYSIVSSINPPTKMLAGQTANVQLVLKNTGSATWYGEGSANPVRLAVLNEDGRSFYTNDGNWLLPYRVKMTDTSVAPGATATFNFTMTAPPRLGLRAMTFVPVLEGLTHFKDTGMYFLTTVN